MKSTKKPIKNIERAIEEGIEENQRNLGYNIMQGAIELFSICLHKLQQEFKQRKIPVKYYDIWSDSISKST